MQKELRAAICFGTFVAGMAILTAPSLAHEMGQDCTNIDNDIARLACFDKAFTGQEESALTPEKAAAEFKALLDLNTPDEIMDVDINPWEPCNVTVTWKLRRVFDTQRNSGSFASFDVDRIESLGRWAYSDRGTAHLKIIGDREAEFSSQSFWGHTAIMPLKDLKLEWLTGGRVNSGRSVNATLLATPYREDVAKAQAALQKYMKACKQ